METIAKVLLIEALITYLVGDENTQDCDYCNEVINNIKHEKTIDGLNEILENYDCSNCH